MTGAKRLKMKDLERATGVGRETIRFYIREGLLPEPERPGRNVAWYDESFVERIAVVKELQRKRYLPLHAIKALIDGEAPPSRAEVEALRAIDGTLYRGLGKVPARVSDVARQTGVSPREIRQLEEVGAIEIVTRRGTQWLEGEAIRFVERWAALRRAGYADALGFGPAKLRVYVDFVRWLAREELRIFARGVAGRVDPETASRMAEDGIDIVNQLIGSMRKATLLRYIAEGNLPEAGAAPRQARAGRGPGP
jgi:DNA-binding transcriptional MerR regulator